MDSTTNEDTLVLSVIEHFDDDDDFAQDEIDSTLQQTRSKTPRGSISRLRLTPVSLSLSASMTRREESSIDIHTISEEKATDLDDARDTGRLQSSSKQSQSHSMSKSKSLSYSSDDFESVSTSQLVADEQIIKRKLRVLRRNERRVSKRRSQAISQQSAAENDSLRQVCDLKLEVLQKNLEKESHGKHSNMTVTRQQRYRPQARKQDADSGQSEAMKVRVSQRVAERLRIEKLMHQMRCLSGQLSSEIAEAEQKQKQEVDPEMQLNELASRKARLLRQQLRARNVDDSDLTMQQARMADLHMREVGRLMRTVAYFSRAENADKIWDKLFEPLQ